MSMSDHTTPAQDWAEQALAHYPALLTFEEAAEALRVSKRTLARYTAGGLLKSVSFGVHGRSVVPRVEIVNFLRQRLA